MGRVSSFCRDFFIERRSIQSKILFPFIVFSFLAILMVVLLVFQILSKNIEARTDRDVLAYRETAEALILEKKKQTIQYGSLLAFFRSRSAKQAESVLERSMDISHMDLLVKEGVKIYIEPDRFLSGGNRDQRELVKRGMRGESYSDLIFKTTENTPRFDFDAVAPYEVDGRTDFVMVGFCLDHDYLDEIQSLINNDLFILQNDRVVASTFHDPQWHEKIEAKITPQLLQRTLVEGENVLAKVYLSGKEYKAVYAPLRLGATRKAIFGLIMSTNDLAQTKRKVINNYIAISVVILVVLTLINFFIVNAMSRPLKEMALLTDSVAHGDLTHRIHIDTQDELSDLADSLNIMVAALQKQREELDLTVEQLIHQEKLASLGGMAAGIAHEVGNPLSIIVGYTRMLLRREPRGENRDHLQRISEAARRIERLSRSLLMYSRPTVQDQESLDINRVIEDSLAMVEHQFKEERNYRVVKRLSPNVRQLTGSPSRLQQVFVNLFNNSFQAMPAGGVLTISTKSSDDREMLVVEISDTGTGIPPSRLSRIFDPFFTTKSEEKGTGLGLSITQRIVSDHQGRIRVASAPGEGTTFTISFPYLPSGSPDQPASQTPQGSPPADHPGRSNR
jgi:signal transduction histidine kinase